MMKKLFSVFVLFCICVFSVLAQFSVSGGIETPYTFTPPKSTGISAVYVFYGLNNAQITYTGSRDNNFVWKSYTTNPSVATIVMSDANKTSTTLENVQDATGYILSINGIDQYYIWVTDYTKYVPSVNLAVSSDSCTVTVLTANLTFPTMFYYSSTGGQNIIPRNFSLNYNSLLWNEQSLAFLPNPITKSIVENTSTTNLLIPLSNVYSNTTFALSGDQFATYFNHIVKYETSLYQAIKPIVMAEGVLTPRNGLNELNRGDNTARRDLEGSATLQVDLNSYANAAATDFTWYIYNQLTPSAYGYYKEQSFHYQFSIFGKYTARVAAANITRGCIAQDSIVINVLESDLEIPNVFTPNGDGMNDKFCVAYKSLVSFKMWVYNRWGRLVFSSSDPSDCWDGSNGGAKSPTGAYYYVVEAMGADGIKYKKAGNINLLRGKD